jgi:Trehalose utilisation
MKSKFFLGLLASVSGFMVCTHNSMAESTEKLQWLSYKGGEGPGKGKHIVLISAEQEYRSEQAIPMLARILSTHHGFDTTVLFSVNAEGMVDPTLPTPDRKDETTFRKHNIPGLEHLAKADSLILFMRLISLPLEQEKLIVNYFDSGKPIIALRTSNHGFAANLDYKINDQQVTLSQIFGGTFMNHHGEWQADSTRGDIVPEMKEHPILKGVKDIWGLTDVYRTYPEGGSLPEGCTALVYGQPLIGREQGGANNPEKEPLPVVWVKNWKTSSGAEARILHSTMGSSKDFQSPGLRRLVINGVYWGLNMEEKIKADSSVEYVGEYQPLSHGFHHEKLGVVPRPVSYYR